MSSLLNMRWIPWVQGDCRKLYVTPEKKKGDINETVIPGSYSFVCERYRGYGISGTGVRLFKEPIGIRITSDFTSCPTKPEWKIPKQCLLLKHCIQGGDLLAPL